MAVRLRSKDLSKFGCSVDWADKPRNYWRDVCRNASNRVRYKLAGTEGQNDSTPFEQAFANLAHSTIRDSAAKLLDYEVGFQLIEKNKDNTKAIGVFGFQLSGQWLYGPVFFLNGDLKGQELLYVKSQSLFVPMSDEWVNYLLGHKPPMLGKEVNRNPVELGIRSPDLQRLIRSPSKIAAALPSIPDWLVGFVEDLPKLALEKVASEDYEAWTLPDIIRSLGKSAVFHVQTAIGEAYPTVLRAFEKFHGSDTLQKIASDLDVEVAAGRGLQSMLRPAMPRQRGSVIKKAAVDAKLRVITRHDVLDGSGEVPINDSHKFDAVEKGISIHDTREEREIAKVYRENQPLAVFSPTETGIYEVFLRPDKFVNCLVVMQPQTSKVSRDASLVFNLESKDWHLASPSRLICVSRKSSEAFEDWLSKQPNATPAKLKGPCFLINSDGTGTSVFSAGATYGGDGKDGVATGLCWRGLSWLDDSQESAYSQSPDFQFHAPPSRHADPVRTADISRISLQPHVRTIRLAGGTLYVPLDARCIEVSDDPKEMPYGEAKELLWSIAANDDRLDVRSNENGFTIVGKDYTHKNAAIKHLLVDWNLSQDAAAEILDDASRKPGSTLKFRVKAAEIPRLVREAPSADAIQDPPTYTDSFMGSNLPTEIPYERGHRVTDLSASTYGPPPRLPDPDVMAIAQRASQKGEKQLFDTSVFQSMLAANRYDTIVGKKLGDIVKGMHAKGCVYFQFLWHGEAFEARYGADDLPGLEDGLRTAFEADGKLVLALKQRSVESSSVDGVKTDLESINQ